MAKLGLMLGLLWAVGCGQLANTSTTAPTTTAKATTPSPTTVTPSISSSAKPTDTTVPTTTINATLLLSTPSKPEGSTNSTSVNVSLQPNTIGTPAPSGTSKSATNNAASSVNATSTLQSSTSVSRAASTSNTVTPSTGHSQPPAKPNQLPTTQSKQSGGPPTTSSVKSTGHTQTVSPLANKHVSATSEKTKTSEKPNKTFVNTSPTSIPPIPGHVSVNPVNISAGSSTTPSISSQTSTHPSQSPASTFQTSVKSENPSVPTLKLPSVISTAALKPSLKPTTNVPIPDNSKVTSEQAIQITCQNTTSHKNYPLTINIKTDGSWNCNQDMNAGKLKYNVEQVCKAIKPGFQAPTDTCKVVLGYNAQNDGKLSVVQAVVETKSDTSDLYSKLKTIKNEDGTPMFAYNDKVENTEYNDWLSMTLIITIVCLAASLLIIAAIYGCWHQKRSQKRDQRLTEELQTMENGYHDNPTLEVMETSPEMQEKKGGLSGELGDSWIVPLDNLTREDLDEEEDTHL